MAFDQDLYKRALEFAARVHGDQKVPGNGFPYVVHVAKVAMEVQAATEGFPTAARRLAVACALLHDTIEDSEPVKRPAVREAIQRDFGLRVLAGVEALTKDDGLPKEERMADSLRRLRKQPVAVRIVKLADRITNLEPPPAHWTQEKRERYVVEARKILAALKGSSPKWSGGSRRSWGSTPGIASDAGVPASPVRTPSPHHAQGPPRATLSASPFAPAFLLPNPTGIPWNWRGAPGTRRLHDLHCAAAVSGGEPWAVALSRMAVI